MRWRNANWGESVSARQLTEPLLKVNVVYFVS
jgi:hypothetical protein